MQLNGGLIFFNFKKISPLWLISNDISNKFN